MNISMKPPGRALLADRRGTVTPRPGPPVVQPLRIKLISGLDHQPDPGEAILPPGGTTSDEFATRLAAWLADVAMNEQGAA